MQKLKNIVVKIWPFSSMQKKMNNLADEIIVLKSKLGDCNHLLETEKQDKRVLLDEMITMESELTDSKQLLERVTQDNNVLLDEISTHKRNIEVNLKCIHELTNNNEMLNNDIKQLNTRCQRLEETTQSLRMRYNLHEPDFNLKSGEFWNNHYERGGNSGTGSYNRLSEFKANIINDFIVSKKIDTTIELGCGDGNQLSLIHYNSYTGVDVSDHIIKQNRKRFSENKDFNFYCSLIERECYINEKFDLSISMDVIFHLLEDDVYEKYMYDLFTISKKYVIIYSSNHEEYTPWPEYRHRNFFYFIQRNIKGWELLQFIPNKYPYIIGREAETSSADFYIFTKSVKSDI